MNAGLTLVEILVAIAILGVVSALLLQNYTGAQKKPYDAAAARCGRAIIDRQTELHAEFQRYFPTIGELGADVAEVCQQKGVVVTVHSNPVASPDGTGCWCMNADPDNLAFQVFSPKGSGYYMYWNKDPRPNPDQLNKLVRW